VNRYVKVIKWTPPSTLSANLATQQTSTETTVVYKISTVKTM